MDFSGGVASFGRTVFEQEHASNGHYSRLHQSVGTRVGDCGAIVFSNRFRRYATSLERGTNVFANEIHKPFWDTYGGRMLFCFHLLALVEGIGD